MGLTKPEWLERLIAAAPAPIDQDTCIFTGTSTFQYPDWNAKDTPNRILSGNPLTFSFSDTIASYNAYNELKAAGDNISQHYAFIVGVELRALAAYGTEVSFSEDWDHTLSLTVDDQEIDMSKIWHGAALICASPHRNLDNIIAVLKRRAEASFRNGIWLPKPFSGFARQLKSTQYPVTWDDYAKDPKTFARVYSSRDIRNI